MTRKERLAQREKDKARRDKRKAGIYAKQAWVIEAEKTKGVES